MEARQRVVELRRVEIRKQPVELPEHGADLDGVLGPLRLVVGDGGGDQGDGAPVLALVVDEEIAALPDRDDAGELPDAIGGVGFAFELGMDVFGDRPHVLHDRLGALEHVLVDALDDDAFLGERRAEDGQVGVVDVPAAGGIDRHQPSRHTELPGDVCQFHALALPSLCRQTLPVFSGEPAGSLPRTARAGNRGTQGDGLE